MFERLRLNQRAPIEHNATAPDIDGLALKLDALEQRLGRIEILLRSIFGAQALGQPGETLAITSAPIVEPAPGQPKLRPVAAIPYCGARIVIGSSLNVVDPA